MKRLFRASTYALILAIAGLFSGCSHPCGYVDVHTRIEPAHRGTMPRYVGKRIVVGEFSGANGILDAKVEDVIHITGLSNIIRSGRKLDVEYQWFAPILKPLAAVTLVAPIWVSARQPQDHRQNGWSAADYFHDLASWFNPFSAVPVGNQRVAMTAEDISLRQATVVQRVEYVRPVRHGYQVALYVGEELRGTVTVDAVGIARFDVAKILTDADRDGKQSIALGVLGATNPQSRVVWPLPAELILSPTAE